jgi:serine O-acetyltransferase
MSRAVAVRAFLSAPVFFYCRNVQAYKALIADAYRVTRSPAKTPPDVALAIASTSRAFRSVAYYRASGPREKLAAMILRRFFPGLPTIELHDTPTIGPGLVIMHGQATVVHAARIGEDCTIYQQVTVGVGRGGFPVIGDRVDLCAGAIVIGGVTIGDDAIIGAGAVITNDVPDRAIVVGSPMRQIGTTKGKRAEEIGWESIKESRSTSAMYQPS